MSTQHIELLVNKNRKQQAHCEYAYKAGMSKLTCACLRQPVRAGKIGQCQYSSRSGHQGWLTAKIHNSSCRECHHKMRVVPSKSPLLTLDVACTMHANSELNLHLYLFCCDFETDGNLNLNSCQALYLRVALGLAIFIWSWIWIWNQVGIWSIQERLKEKQRRSAKLWCC